MGEHRFCKAGVVGSTPTGSTLQVVSTATSSLHLAPSWVGQDRGNAGVPDLRCDADSHADEPRQ